MRVACLLVPDLPLRAELRTRPELRGLPLVVTSGPDSRAQVVAASAEARATGIDPPCALTRARAACPEVRVRMASPVAEQAARHALLDVAFSCAPRAALAPRGSRIFAAEAAVFVDASGVESIYRSEAGFATALGARAESVGLPGAVSITSSRSAALLAGRALLQAERCGPSTAAGADAVTPVRVWPAGEEHRFLDDLPIDLLDPEDRLAQQLTRFGVRNVRDLLRLPRRASTGRLGPEVLQLMARARGEEFEPPLPEATDRWIEESFELEYPAERMEPLRFVLRGMLSRLIERLVLRGLACGPLELELGLAGQGVESRRIATAAPTRELRVLLRLIDLALEEHPPGAAVERLRLATEGRSVRRDQLDLFRPRGPDPAVLDQTLAELEALCGHGRVGAPAVPDDHRPDAFGLVPFRTRTRSARGRRAGGGGSEPLPLPAPSPTDPAASSDPVVRALRPPVAARVRLRQGRPDQIESAVASGRVVHASGPWRTTGFWWSDKRFALDHYDVQVSDGTVLRLAFDFVTRSWRIDALYD